MARHNLTWEEYLARLLDEDPEVRALWERDQAVIEAVRGVLQDRGLPIRWAMQIGYAVIDELDGHRLAVDQKREPPRRGSLSPSSPQKRHHPTNGDSVRASAHTQHLFRSGIDRIISELSDPYVS